MPQFRVQRSNTHFFFFKFFLQFFLTQCERHKKQERGRDKNKNANNRIQDANKNETRWNIVYESASIVHFKNRIELLEELKVGIFWFP